LISRKATHHHSLHLIQIESADSSQAYRKPRAFNCQNEYFVFKGHQTHWQFYRQVDHAWRYNHIRA